jgi:hypothetical protein
LLNAPLEEYLVFASLLLAVWGLYILLKLHYIFAFGLVKNTSISEEKKQKIEKIKIYLFAFLKVLFLLGLIAMFVFSSITLINGESLKSLVIDLWQSIPEGFWLSMLWTLFRIAVLIIIMRFVLKTIYKFLDKQEANTIKKDIYKKENINLFYLRLHNSIKFSIVLGVMYRIVHFFPFLEEVSYVFLFALVFFVMLSFVIVLKELVMMWKSSYNKILKEN